MKKILNFLISRLREPSTYRGAALLITAAGVNVHPELLAEIVTTGVGIAGIIGIITKDK